MSRVSLYPTCATFIMPACQEPSQSALSFFGFKEGSGARDDTRTAEGTREDHGRCILPMPSVRTLSRTAARSGAALGSAAQSASRYSEATNMRPSRLRFWVRAPRPSHLKLGTSMEMAKDGERDPRLLCEEALLFMAQANSTAPQQAGSAKPRS